MMGKRVGQRGCWEVSNLVIFHPFHYGGPEIALADTRTDGQIEEGMQ